MRLVIVTFGTEGDARPLAALGHALREAGHEVLLMGDARTLGAARALGVPVVVLSGDIRQEFGGSGPKGGLRVAKALVALMNVHVATWIREICAAAEGCDAVITSGLASFAGFPVAEHFGIPAIGAATFPLTPSREFRSPLLPLGWIPAWLNRASMVLTDELPTVRARRVDQKPVRRRAARRRTIAAPRSNSEYQTATPQAFAQRVQLGAIPIRTSSVAVNGFPYFGSAGRAQHRALRLVELQAMRVER